MAQATLVLQVASLIVYSASFVASLILWRRFRDVRALLVSPLLWTGSGSVYYVLLLGGAFNPQETLLWGAVHRLLGSVMVLGLIIALWAILSAGAAWVGPRPGEYPDDDRGD